MSLFGVLLVMLAVCGDTGGSASATLIIVADPARIELTPDRATNAIGEPHVFTVHLEIYDGTGWVDAVGETVEINIVSGEGRLSPEPYITDSHGKAHVLLNSNIPGVISVEASWNGIIDDEKIEISDRAEKTYIETGARLTLVPDGEHPVGEIHDLIAHLETYAGSGGEWTAAAGEPIEIDIVDGPGFLTLGPYTTDANGDARLDISSDVVGTSDIDASWSGLVAGRPAAASDSAQVLWYDSTIGGGGGAAEECEERCPPPIPALYATKRSELLQDQDEDGSVGPGDVVRYTMLVTNFAPFSVDEVEYIEILDPHTRVDASSLADGAVQLSMRDLDGTEVVYAFLGTIIPDEEIIFSFDVRIDDDLPPGIMSAISQGTLYAGTTSPVCTDDPSTDPIHDATSTVIANSNLDSAGGGAPRFRELNATKTADVQEAEILRVVEPGGRVSYSLGFENTSSSPLTNVRLVDISGPYIHARSWASSFGSVQIWNVGSAQVLIADFPEIPPGEFVELSYEAFAQQIVPVEVGYSASRGMLSGEDVASLLTDDPSTTLADDATSVLFPYRCLRDTDEDRTWEDWLEVVSEAPTGLFPLVMEEKDSTQHLRWVLYGGDFFRDLSIEPSSRPPSWSQWALVGLVELAFSGIPTSDLGFRLAERKEPHVAAFLAEEPFFMWIQYDSPLYGRVPAVDKGKLLHCDGLLTEFCERAYLPLLVELDWSRDWDMLWLEDDLIVATIIQEIGQP
ncbi:hypothetical protein ACFLSZ_05065 [Candidatus Bipolaricaulota bacterium]